MCSCQGRRSIARYLPPTHYSFKVESFSSLSKLSIDKYTSEEFEEGGYKWQLSMYPNGSKERGGKDHISIYVGLVNTCSLPVGWEVNANINMFVYNQIEDTYLTLPDGGKATRLHAMRTEWGVASFMGLDEFSEPSNGYLVDDTCVFGVDIFVLKQTIKGQSLCLLNEPETGNLTWPFKTFSNLSLERYESATFVVGDYKWKIRMYPRGNGAGKGNSLSVFLALDESTLPPDTRVLVKHILRLTTQNPTRDDRVELESITHFGPACMAYGNTKFISLAKLAEPTKGFLLNDTCKIEAEVFVLGTLTPACEKSLSKFIPKTPASEKSLKKYYFG